MQTAEAKSATRQSAKNVQPFFNKVGGGMSSDNAVKDNNSFNSTQQNTFFKAGNHAVQRKLSIGEPNDKYEKEANATADKVVQRLNKKEPSMPALKGANINAIQAKPIAPLPAITPLIQTKKNSTDPEEKLQKKEEEEQNGLAQGELQKKPIFDSNPQPPDDKNGKLQSTGFNKKDKLQKEEKNNNNLHGRLQRKAIFESNEPAFHEVKNIQKKTTSNDKKEDETIQKKETGDTAPTASPSIESSLSATKGAGNPLPAETRTQMENSFGADFSGVRIHNNSAASQLSEDLNAQAFTHGNDIYFNAGKYDDTSSSGQHLLAHELTHTMQQGASVQKKELPSTQSVALIQKAPLPAKGSAVSSEVVDISKGTFSPSDKVKSEIDAVENKGKFGVRIKAGAFASEGIIVIKKDGETYDSTAAAYLPLTNVWLQKIPALALRVDVKSNQVKGLVTIKGGKEDQFAWLKTLSSVKETIGIGFNFKGIPATPNVVNKLENGTLSLGFSDIDISIGGFFNLKLNLALQNMNTPVFDGTAEMTIKGAKGTVSVDNKTGKLGGAGSLAVDGFKGFSGTLEVKYDPETGAVDIHGKAAYAGDKLSGNIELVATDLDTANNFAKDAIKAAGGIQNAQEAVPPAAVPAPAANKKRGLAGVGQLEFHLTEWFAGTVNVIVDAAGHVTVIGKIAPPAEIELFKQKNWNIPLFNFEAKAYYGIPVVGNLNLFANISLAAIAKLGPAKIYNIEILGTYSTDPTVQKSIQIAGSINVSAYAGLSLRAEGGAGIEILDHDLKFGIGVTADVGVEAYADARPTIGWREPGEFFISGTLDMIAQPMLALGGDFFIKIVTPWWSPLSDKTWTWPLFAKQWPLSDPIGLSATLKDYVLGSGNVPEVEFKKPEFDPSKFMTNMVDDTLPDKAGADGPGHGTFKEDGSVKPPEITDPKKPKKEDAAPGKGKDKKAPPPTKPAKAKPNAKDNAAAVEAFKAAGKQLQKIKDPINKADLRAKLNEIEAAVSGIKFDVKLVDNKWVVSSTAKGIANPKTVKYTAMLTEADKKAAGKTDSIEAALGEIDNEGKQKMADGEVSKTDADQIVADVKKDHAAVIQSISVLDGGETWNFEYIQKTEKKITKKLIDVPSINNVEFTWTSPVGMGGILDKHMEGGRTAMQRTRDEQTVFHGLNEAQIKRVVRGAYKNINKKMETQGPRIQVKGQFENWTVVFWINKETRIVETAYPIFNS